MVNCPHEELLAGNKFVCIRDEDPHPTLPDGREMHFMVREEYAHDRLERSV